MIFTINEYTISVENCLMLERDVTVEQIKETIFSMKANKAPGPDGYTSDFFKVAWPVVGGDVVAASRNFFCVWMSSKRGQCYNTDLSP